MSGVGQVFSRSNASPLAEWWRTIDKGLMAFALFLLAAGLVLSLSAGPAAASRIGFDDPFYFVYRQVAFALAAGGLLLAASTLSAVWARRLAVILFLVCFLLMAAILLVGHEAKGAQRWIRIGGATFQPSEIIKPALIVVSAWLLAQRERFPDGPWEPVAFAFYAVTMGLLLLQPDVGQAVLLTAAFVIVFFVSGLPWTWAAAFLAGGAGLAIGLYLLLPHVRIRIDSFVNPTAYDTYQIDKAREAMERGGLFGAGPGEGTIKSSLPDAHTDFIYSVAGEEFGLFSCVLLALAFAVISIKGVMDASRNSDVYQRAAGVGLFAMFGLQAAINMAVNVGLIPPKGMTLPLVSSGGSSLLGSALTLGLALALTRRRHEGTFMRLRPA
ncbi:MAG: putative peptidoglycan glycosyltransferase FtsW [Alphaproteobacteria bacterium]|nr:putative peptidoglycan glycosyltransferase FtsW [Alphaproteobacteria bacterium]